MSEVMESAETLSKTADKGKEAISGDEPMCGNCSGFNGAAPTNMTGAWENDSDIIMLVATFDVDSGKATQTPSSKPTPLDVTGLAPVGNPIRSSLGVRGRVTEPFAFIISTCREDEEGRQDAVTSPRLILFAKVFWFRYYIVPSGELLNHAIVMAYRTSWTQSQCQERTVWSFPLHFSEFVHNPDVDDSQLIDFFRRDWFPHPNALKYVRPISFSYDNVLLEIGIPCLLSTSLQQIYVQMKDSLMGKSEDVCSEGSGE
ncbi:hypothetical protein PIB30_006849 [Stylosanthes scabra]|uniref:Aminotransferase-like plant mobile domain-containing protein n=1 Tax=Stylosanthes scabra TaxID=79078 RepID=A0ABU6V688_9FABA|nr:hypothetical protein [Stylosanthes scabra]